MNNLIITTPHELKTLILDVLKEHQLFTPKTENTPLNGVGTAKKYYSRKETAFLLSITLPTLSKYVKNGIINSHRIGNRVLFKVLDIENALTNRKF
jgi:excisionase family DNA binding protein